MERERRAATPFACEDTFRDLFIHSAIGISLTSPTGEVHVNEEFARMLDLSREELEGKNWQDVSHPDDIELTKRHVQTLLSGVSDTAHFTKRYLRKDGGVVWADLRTALRRSAAGEPLYFMTFVSDITDRVIAEEGLRKSEVQHRTVLATAMDGFWIVDLDGRLLEVNETYCRLSGYSHEELAAMRVTDLEALESAADMAAHISKVMRIGEDRFESRHRRKDGTFFDVDVSVQYRSYDGGRLICFVRDITRHKHTEQELERQLAELRRWQDVMLDREDRVRELKREINQLCQRNGEPGRYPGQLDGPAETVSGESGS